MLPRMIIYGIGLVIGIGCLCASAFNIANEDNDTKPVSDKTQKPVHQTTTTHTEDDGVVDEAIDLGILTHDSEIESVVDATLSVFDATAEPVSATEPFNPDNGEITYREQGVRVATCSPWRDTKENADISSIKERHIDNVIPFPGLIPIDDMILDVQFTGFNGRLYRTFDAYPNRRVNRVVYTSPRLMNDDAPEFTDYLNAVAIAEYYAIRIKTLRCDNVPIWAFYLFNRAKHRTARTVSQFVVEHVTERRYNMTTELYNEIAPAVEALVGRGRRHATA